MSESELINIETTVTPAQYDLLKKAASMVGLDVETFIVMAATDCAPAETEQTKH